MSTSWDDALAKLLHELSAVQGELLALLNEKRDLLLAADGGKLQAMQAREQALIEKLQACHARRGELLKQAEEEGRPGDSIRSLAQSLPRESRDRLYAPLQETTARARLLQHKSLTNWVVVQRTLLHLAQLLEIIANRGRAQPTYGIGPAAPQTAGGALVDQAA